MDYRYLGWLRELVSLGLYKACGCSDLRRYRPYYASGFMPYSAVVQLFDDEFEGGAIPDIMMEAHESLSGKTRRKMSHKPVGFGVLLPYQQYKLFY